MRAWRRCAVAVLCLPGLALVATSCTSSSGSNDGPGVTVAKIRKAKDVCPLPLDDAATDAGRSGAASASVTISPGSQAPPVSVDASPAPDSALGVIGGGVSVDCTTAIGSGTVTVTLIAATATSAERQVAATTLLPAVSSYGNLPQSALPGVATRAATTKPGHLVPLGDGVPAALGIVTVGGALSSAFVLHGRGVTAAVIRSVGEHLAERMG